jgi:hypothetical protein
VIVMADAPNVTEQVPAGGGVNEPASGTYGAGADLERIQQRLPGMSGGGEAPTPAPLPPVGSPSGSPMGPPPPYLAPGLLRPSSRPGVPVGTPLEGPPLNPVAAAGTGMQQRLALAQSLAEDPNVSESTRELAQRIVQLLIERSRG